MTRARRCGFAAAMAVGLSASAAMAEVVVVTSYQASGALTPNPPYWDGGGSWTLNSFHSTLTPYRSRSLLFNNNTGTIVITPTLAISGGLYRVQITHPVRPSGSSNQVSADILVDVSVSGGTLTDAAGHAVTNTTAFRRPGGNVWETVGRLRIDSDPNTPTVITFTAHGSFTDRFYSDGFRFESVEPCPTPFADADRDGDVDQDDFAAFQLCFSGSGRPMPGNDCDCFDRDPTTRGDLDVDSEDLKQFKKCITGPAVLWTQGLTPNCLP